jgi:hypothetical protein
MKAQLRPKLLKPTPRERLSIVPQKMQRPRDSKTRPVPD